MSLIEYFSQRKKKNYDENASLTNELKKETLEDADGYYFENINEMVTYGKKTKKNTLWLKGNQYIDCYKKGYQLFEEGKYQEAIAAYRECLKYNPIGINARFEIVEALIQQFKLQEAKSTLVEMRDLLVDNRDIAKYYRRLGFIEIDLENYRLAMACLLLSRNFDNLPALEGEIKYLKSRAGEIAVYDPEDEVEKAGLLISH